MIMKKKLIVSIALALVIVAVLAVCLSGCDKISSILTKEYKDNGYNELYAHIEGIGISWIKVDSYKIYDNNIIIIEASDTGLSRVHKTKYITNISKVVFESSKDIYTQ